MSISIRCSDQQSALIKDFAKLHGTTMSSFILDSVMSRIEDMIDIQDYQNAMAAYQNDPVTYSQDEVEKMLGTSNE